MSLQQIEIIQTHVALHFNNVNWFWILEPIVAKYRKPNHSIETIVIPKGGVQYQFVFLPPTKKITIADYYHRKLFPIFTQRSQCSENKMQVQESNTIEICGNLFYFCRDKGAINCYLLLSCFKIYCFYNVMNSIILLTLKINIFASKRLWFKDLIHCDIYWEIIDVPRTTISVLMFFF